MHVISYICCKQMCLSLVETMMLMIYVFVATGVGNISVYMQERMYFTC